MAFDDYKKHPHSWLVASGDMKNHYRVYKFGSNAAIGSSPEVIWSGGGDYLGFLTTATTISIVSASAADNGVTPGLGARAITVQGLDENYKPKQDHFLLNGTTPVVSTSTWMRVFRAFVTDAGSNTNLVGPNLGNIAITSTGAGTPVMAEIPVNVGQTLMAVFTVPAGYKALVEQVDANVGQGKDATVSLKTRQIDENGGGPWQVKARRFLYQNSFTKVYSVPTVIHPKTDILMMGQVTVPSAAISATFEFVLVQDEGREQQNLYSDW